MLDPPSISCEMSIWTQKLSHREATRCEFVYSCFFEYLEYCVPSPRLIILHASEDSQPNQEEARLGLGLLPVPLISPWAALQNFRKLLSAWVLNKWLWSFLLQIVRTDLKELRDFNNLDGAPWLHSFLWQPQRDGWLQVLEVRVLGQSLSWAKVPYQVLRMLWFDFHFLKINFTYLVW